MAKPKRPTDINQRAKLIVLIATGEIDEKKGSIHEKSRAGGKKGGKARADKLTPEERKKIARKAAEKRWEFKR